jgi:hypothetical protein
MLITKEALKTLINGLVAKMQNYRGNWNQSDPTASDYIKNKPFYTEKDVYKEILSDTSIEYTEWFEDEFKITEPMVEGNTYTVVWNGTEYPCIAQDEWGYITLDNSNTANTNECFYIEA